MDDSPNSLLFPLNNPDILLLQSQLKKNQQMIVYLIPGGIGLSFIIPLLPSKYKFRNWSTIINDYWLIFIFTAAVVSAALFLLLMGARQLQKKIKADLLGKQKQAIEILSDAILQEPERGITATLLRDKGLSSSEVEQIKKISSSVPQNSKLTVFWLYITAFYWIL